MFALFSHSTNNLSLEKHFRSILILQWHRHKQATSSTLREKKRKIKGSSFFISMHETGKRITATAHMFHWISWPISKSLHDCNHMLKKGRTFLYPKYFGIFGCWLKSVVQMFDAAAIKMGLLLNNYEHVQ